MKPWLRSLLIVVAVVAVLYGAFAAFASYSNGHDVDVEVHVGKTESGMYMRCAKVTGAECSGGDQMTLTVKQRDRIHFTVVDDDGGGHRHDFNIEGWQYFLPPASAETELNSKTETASITAWATGTFHVLCELTGHDAAGMHGTLVVQ